MHTNAISLPTLLLLCVFSPIIQRKSVDQDTLLYSRCCVRFNIMTTILTRTLVAELVLRLHTISPFMIMELPAYTRMVQ